MKLWSDGWTQEDWAAWHAKFKDLPEPEGCIACGAIAGCCAQYPNCPGNPDWTAAVANAPEEP